MECKHCLVFNLRRLATPRCFALWCFIASAYGDNAYPLDAPSFCHTFLESLSSQKFHDTLSNCVHLACFRRLTQPESQSAPDPVHCFCTLQTFFAEQKLWTNPANFRAFKVLIAAEYNGVEVEVPEFNHPTDSKSPEFVAKSPLGRVPVLETPQVRTWA